MESLSMVKKELLCQGLRISESAQSVIERVHPLFGSNIFVHAAQLVLQNGTYVNACVNELFCLRSPYEVIAKDDHLLLTKNNMEVCTVSIATLPTWYNKETTDGEKMISVLSLHGKNVLALTNHNGCYFKKIGQGCAFCSSNSDYFVSQKILAKRICEVLTEAFSDGAKYSLSLSGGILPDDSRGIAYFIYLINEIKSKFPYIKISVEVAPPAMLKFLHMLKDAGADAICMNIEFFDEKVRSKICPGKSSISLDDYFSALKLSVELFGISNVNSVLIAGIESISSTITGAKKLIDIGVVPTIIPFRPYDKCLLSLNETTSPRILVQIEKALDLYLKESRIHFMPSYACLSCGACDAYEGIRNGLGQYAEEISC